MASILRLAFLALCLGLIGFLGLPNAGLAQGDATNNSQPSAQALGTPAGKLIQNLGDKAISVIANSSLSEDQRESKFRELLRNSFDLMTIGRFVIGRSWNAATPEQQKDYMHLFEELVVKTYASRLTIYTGEGFRVTSERPEGDKDFIVNSQITHPDGSEPTEIDWRVRQKSDKLGIIDVMVEGVSLSVTQRQEYAAVIQRNGGDIGPLLDLMRQRLQEPSPPTPN